MRVFCIKLFYLLCTPLVWMYLLFAGVKFRYSDSFCGFPYIFRKRKSQFQIGSNVRFLSATWSNLLGLNHRCIISTSNPDAKLTIGNNCGFSGVTIWCFDKIQIDDNVRVGANCTITDGDAHQDDPRAGENKPIHICKNVWLGANVVVLKGVTIGENSLIGMNSVVTKDIPANVVAAGNPCRVIKQMSEETIKKLSK